MRMRKYEKPVLRFVNIRNERNIAEANCWSRDANDTTRRWYYDYDNPDTPGGDGYVCFTLGGSCGGNKFEILEYIQVPEDEYNGTVI